MRMRVKILLLALLGYLVAIFLNYGRYVQGDFSIYFVAGRRVRNNLSLYDADNNLYVYGPLLAHLLSPFSNLDELQASRAWLILSIIAVNISAWVICRLFLATFPIECFILSASILNLSFASRNNLGNGNVMAFVLLALVLSLGLALEKEGKKNILVLALITLFVFEVKTYIAIFLILFLIICKKIKSLLAFGALVLITNVFYLSTSDNSYLNWLESLKLRSENLRDGTDQATIFVFLSNLASDSNLIFLVLVISSYLVLLFLMFKALLIHSTNKKYQGLILFAASPTITLFAHGQDFIVSTLVLAVLLLYFGTQPVGTMVGRNYLIIATGLVVNWTNEQILAALPILFVIAITLNSTNMSKGYVSIALGIAGCSTLFLRQLLNQDGDIQYVAYNFQALIFGLTVFFAALKIKVKKPIAESGK